MGEVCDRVLHEPGLKKEVAINRAKVRCIRQCLSCRAHLFSPSGHHERGSSVQGHGTGRIGRRTSRTRTVSSSADLCSNLSSSSFRFSDWCSMPAPRKSQRKRRKRKSLVGSARTRRKVRQTFQGRPLRRSPAKPSMSDPGCYRLFVMRTAHVIMTIYASNVCSPLLSLEEIFQVDSHVSLTLCFDRNLTRRTIAIAHFTEVSRARPRVY